MTNQVCSVCQSPSLFKQGIKKETGKPWSGYFCQNQACKHVDWTPKASPKPQNSPVVQLKQESGEMLVMEEINALNARFDKLIAYLVKKLGV